MPYAQVRLVGLEVCEYEGEAASLTLRDLHVMGRPNLFIRDGGIPAPHLRANDHVVLAVEGRGIITVTAIAEVLRG